MIEFKGPYINGHFQKHDVVPYIKKVDPGNIDRIIGHWDACPDAIDEAVEQADRAFQDWAWISEKRRFSYLKNLQAVFRQHADRLAEIISSEMGKPLRESQAEVVASLNKIEYMLQTGMKIIHPRMSKKESGCYKYHPRGVLAIIGPFNFPLQLPNAQWVPALASGDTVVFKPSELTPFTGQMIAECFDEAEFPKGVFNIVYGKGDVGHRLVEHPKVSGVLFVGSENTGRRVMAAARKDPNKICVLEMGGKNAAIIFADANLKRAISDCASSALSTTGQRCNSLSRIILHESLFNEFIPKFIHEVLHWPIGYYSIDKNRIGPLVSKEALKSYFHYDKLASKEAATLLPAYHYKAEHPGYYINPTVYHIEDPQADPKQKGYRYDEIFAPNIAIYTFRKRAEAIRLHNDCRYGLVASVFSQKKSIFTEMYHHLEVGNLHWNRPTIGASLRLPFGGIKASGNNFPAGSLSPLYCTYPVAIRM